MSRSLPEREYIQFQKARQSSFASRLTSNRFRQWILNEDANQMQANRMPLPVIPLVWEILQHLAYELVGTMTDLVFQIREQKGTTIVGDPSDQRVFITESLPPSVTMTAILPQVKTCDLSSPFLFLKKHEVERNSVSSIKFKCHFLKILSFN